MLNRSCTGRPIPRPLARSRTPAVVRTPVLTTSAAVLAKSPSWRCTPPSRRNRRVGRAIACPAVRLHPEPSGGGEHRHGRRRGLAVPRGPRDCRCRSHLRPCDRRPARVRAPGRRAARGGRRVHWHQEAERAAATGRLPRVPVAGRRCRGVARLPAGTMRCQTGPGRVRPAGEDRLGRARRGGTRQRPRPPGRARLRAGLPKRRKPGTGRLSGLEQAAVHRARVRGDDRPGRSLAER